MTGPLTTRRAAVAAGAAGLTAAALSACGGDSTDGGGGEEDASPPAGETEGGTDADVLIRTEDVPEGGGVILEEPNVVVVQPEAGEFRAYSSICTHEGCPVSSVADGHIHCTCHNSLFDVQDGSVVQGPARDPLPEQRISVDGGDVRLA